MRTLILDDDQIFLAVAESYVASLGAAHIQTTTDHIEALDILHNEHIDLVMMDLNMPNQDGFAFLRSLAEAGYAGSIIVVSGEKSSIVSSSGYIGEKLGLNVCGTLSKPLDMTALKRAYECAKVSVVELQNSKQQIEAVPDGKLTPMLYYQPQVDVTTGALIGTEALLRGVDENDNIFNPSKVLREYRSLKERYELAEHLFDVFCADLYKFREAGFTNRFSFNVDASNLESADFADMLLDTVDNHGVMPSDIVIELLESHLPQNESWLLEVIARLSMAGFEIAMDDFSTGASSFELLRAGAFAEIKLDANLVQNSAKDVASAKFITNAIQIGEALDMRVIAEGVETEGDLQRMQNMGIKCVQGFFVAKPLCSSELRKSYLLSDVTERAVG